LSSNMKSTVLYVEDNDDNIRLVQRILKLRPEVELLIATDGQQGLDVARSAIPGLILLDRRLPDMLGVEVLRTLKAAVHTAMIPVVVLSGDSARGHATEVLGLGAEEFLVKPFEIGELLDIVDRFCPNPPASPHAGCGPARPGG
jgi:CheY-like chemotaxis protein